MNKCPVLALVSLLFLASVSCFPLNEPIVESETSVQLTNNEDFYDISDIPEEDYSNDKIEDFVLGSPSPRTVNAGLCYQDCPKDTVSNCKNVPPNTFKYLTKGQRNYCSSLCKTRNIKCG